MTAADVQAAFCATLVDEWVRAGVREAVVAPGSRSTPLLVALAGDGRLRLHTVLDERSAGFVAVGIGLASGRVVPVVTTSGTAAVELHPAVVEAHQAGVPLLAVTADRPPELHGVGAPQTIEQEGLFGSALRWACSPGVPVAETASTWRSLASRAVAVAAGSGPAGPGPVHLNLAFREPLLGDEAGGMAAGRPDGRPWHSPGALRPGAPSGPTVAALAARAGSDGLIVAGAGCGDPAAVLALGRALGWPVLADPRSGCRVPDPLVIAAADALLRVPDVAAWRPELVVRLGRPWASKILGSWLAALPAAEQILVDPAGQWADPDRVSAEVVAADPAALARAVVGAVGAPAEPSAWCRRWSGAEAAAQRAIDAALAAEGGVTEPGLARALAAALPDGADLVVSSSMPVRDVEWYAAPRTGLRVLSNRGANGIDGVVSTALGAALGRPDRPTAALLGDLAFVYDAGALLWAAGRDAECTLVVVDNDGGGIFSFLPQASALDPGVFERHWGTPHGLDLPTLAAAYRVPVAQLGDLGDLPDALAGPPGHRGVRVVVARTDRATNVAVHERVHAAVAAAVAATG